MNSVPKNRYERTTFVPAFKDMAFCVPIPHSAFQDPSEVYCNPSNYVLKTTHQMGI